MWVFCALWFFICGESGLSLWLLCDYSSSWLVAFSTISLTRVYVFSCVVCTIYGASVVCITILWLHNIILIILWLCLYYVVFVSPNCSFLIPMTWSLMFIILSIVLSVCCGFFCLITNGSLTSEEENSCKEGWQKIENGLWSV